MQPEHTLFHLFHLVPLGAIFLKNLSLSSLSIFVRQIEYSTKHFPLTDMSDSINSK